MYKIVIANLLFLLMPHRSFAQTVTGPQPIVETTYVNSGVPDPDKAGEFLPTNGNWGFRVAITNTSNRPISCLIGKFNASLKVFGESCSRTDTDTYQTQVKVWPESTPRIKIAPGGTYPAAGGASSSSTGNISPMPMPIPKPAAAAKSENFFGNQERINRGQSDNFSKDDKATLSYCGREYWDTKCGYDCPNGKSYDEKWNEDITGGSKEFYCRVDGQVKRTDAKVDCKAGYSVDPANDRCLEVCDYDKYVQDGVGCKAKSCGDYPHGKTWTVPVTFGTASYVCNYGTSKYEGTTCTDEYYEPNGQSCKPKTTRLVYNVADLPDQCERQQYQGKTYKACKASQFEAFGPYIKLPHEGHVIVRFYVKATFQIDTVIRTPPPDETLIYKVDAVAGGRLLAEKKLKVADLTKTGPRPGDPAYVRNHLDYTTGVGGPEGSSAITLEFDTPLALENVEFRVLTGDANFYNRNWIQTEVFYTPSW